MFVFSYFFRLNVHYDGWPFVECKCDVELIWGESAEVLQALLSLGGHLCTKHSKQPKLHCYTYLHIIIFFIQNHKSSTPTGKKNANLSWCPGCFSNSKTRSSLLMAAACESAVSVFTDQAWESSHVQTLTRTVQHVNSKSKLFGSVTCMFFT